MESNVKNEFKIDGIDYSESVHGLLCGRFQPLHYGHFEFIDNALNFVDFLIIGITNPDSESINYSQMDLNRSMPHANIFTYHERMTMANDLMKHYFYNKNYNIIPFNLKNTIEIIDKLPSNLLIFNTIYDKWGEEKNKLFLASGKPIYTLWRRNEKITTATNVRYRIFNNKEWEHLVPPTTKYIIFNIGINEITRRTLSYKV